MEVRADDLRVGFDYKYRLIWLFDPVFWLSMRFVAWFLSSLFASRKQILLIEGLWWEILHRSDYICRIMLIHVLRALLQGTDTSVTVSRMLYSSLALGLLRHLK